MTRFNRKYARGIWLTAISLILIYTGVTTAVDLFHNHCTLEVRGDCPACLWHQLSQDSDQGPSLTEQIIAEFSATILLPPPSDQETPAAEDISGYWQIRAPPAC